MLEASALPGPPLPLRDASRNPEQDRLSVTEYPALHSDRFISEEGKGALTYYEDWEARTKHLVAGGCQECALQMGCALPFAVDASYVEQLSSGENFKCDMINSGISSAVRISPAFLAEVEEIGHNEGLASLLLLVLLLAVAFVVAAAFALCSVQTVSKRSFAAFESRAESDAEASDASEPLVAAPKEASRRDSRSISPQPPSRRVSATADGGQDLPPVPPVPAPPPPSAHWRAALPRDFEKGLKSSLLVPPIALATTDYDIVTVTQQGLRVAPLNGLPVPLGVPVLTKDDLIRLARDAGI